MGYPTCNKNKKKQNLAWKIANNIAQGTVKGGRKLEGNTPSKSGQELRVCLTRGQRGIGAENLRV